MHMEEEVKQAYRKGVASLLSFREFREKLINSIRVFFEDLPL